jgi:hypothetical protein
LSTASATQVSELPVIRDAANDEQLFLHYIYSLGAHGANKY